MMNNYAELDARLKRAVSEALNSDTDDLVMVSLDSSDNTWISAELMDHPRLVVVKFTIAPDSASRRKSARTLLDEGWHDDGELLRRFGRWATKSAPGKAAGVITACLRVLGCTVDEVEIQVGSTDERIQDSKDRISWLEDLRARREAWWEEHSDAVEAARIRRVNWGMLANAALEHARLAKEYGDGRAYVLALAREAICKAASHADPDGWELATKPEALVLIGPPGADMEAVAAFVDGHRPLARRWIHDSLAARYADALPILADHANRWQRAFGDLLRDQAHLHEAERAVILAGVAVGQLKPHSGREAATFDRDLLRKAEFVVGADRRGRLPPEFVSTVRALVDEDQPW